MNLNLKIKRWPIERLIPFARNPRTHTEEQIAQIAASMVEFGWTNPVLVGADGVIIAGHARLAAARKLGLAEVPVIVLDHLSEAQRRRERLEAAGVEVLASDEARIPAGTAGGGWAECGSIDSLGHTPW